jgi:hypothetical protein
MASRTASPTQPIRVTDNMKRAGAAVLASSSGLPKEELAAEVYRAMVEAEPGIPVGTGPVRDEVADAQVLDGGGDERKKRES